VGDYLSGITPGVSVLLRIGNFLLSLAVITVLFAAIFMYLPDARIRWKDVWVGALFTAVLFSIGRYLIGLYMGQTTLASTYGAAGSLVILLLWVFYSAQIVLFGAEFTHAYARHFGTEIRPGKHARQMHPGDHVGGAAPGTA
jgi:membrane protein